MNYICSIYYRCLHSPPFSMCSFRLRLAGGGFDLGNKVNFPWSNGSTAHWNQLSAPDSWITTAWAPCATVSLDLTEAFECFRLPASLCLTAAWADQTCRPMNSERKEPTEQPTDTNSLSCVFKCFLFVF